MTFAAQGCGVVRSGVRSWRYGFHVSHVRKIWPAINPDKLHPGYAGIRPKLSGPGEPMADFVIQGEEIHGLPGLINLFGIESPGLTSSLAIARRAAALA